MSLTAHGSATPHSRAPTEKRAAAVDDPKQRARDGQCVAIMCSESKP